MSTQGTNIPAGWYPDPDDATRGRYWDGVTWTDLRHTPGQPYPAGATPKAPPGTDWNTPWIWLIVLLPLVPSLLMLGVPWGSMFAFDLDDPQAASRASFAIFLSPFYWAATVTGYVVYGLSVFFAYRDMKALAARGVPKPFHWAFTFIGGVVYAIGRSIVVARRTGRGHAPIWAEVGVILVSLIVVVVIFAAMFSGMAELFRDLPASPR